MDAQYAAAFAAAQQQNQYLMANGMQGMQGIPGMNGMQGMGVMQGMPGMGYEYPLSGIDYPGMNDVMCGRGGGTNNHIGNIRFRQLVNEHKLRYLAASKVDKPKVAMEVVQIWRALDPPGRFLTKTDAAQGDDSLWHDVGDKKSREKASQCLRERTPDVMPFVKQLQDEEKKKKDEKKKGGDEKSTNTSSIKSGSKGSKSKSAAETVVSSATPDATQSMASAPANDASTSATPDVTHSNKTGVEPYSMKDKSRDKVAQTIPTAAALMENVFDDEDFDGDEDDHLSYFTYQKQMHDFLETHPKGENGDEFSVTDRSLMMDAMSMASKEWIKSYQSVGSGGSAMMMSIGNSSRLHDNEGEMPPPSNMSKAEMTSTRSQKMSQAGQNSISMLSDLTDFSSLRNKSTRAAKLQSAKAPSGFSMMSELTDLSEGLKDMGLQRGNM